MVILRSLPDSPFSSVAVPGGPFGPAFRRPDALFPSFYLAMNFIGLRRNASSLQIINQTQEFPEQFPRHRHLGQLEHDVPAIADHLRIDLDQHLP
jgi:hypothetical protein